MNIYLAGEMPTRSDTV